MNLVAATAILPVTADSPSLDHHMDATPLDTATEAALPPVNDEPLSSDNVTTLGDPKGKPRKWKWREPECNSFGRQPSDEPGWNHAMDRRAYCECRTSNALYRCRIAIPNDHVIDFHQVKYAEGGHWECGQSVYNSIHRGRVNKMYPSCVLAYVSNLFPVLFRLERV